jgi:hypothetical protein
VPQEYCDLRTGRHDERVGRRTFCRREVCATGSSNLRPGGHEQGYQREEDETMRRGFAIGAAFVGLLLVAGGVQANDIWEAATSSCSNDDTATGTCNQLRHGAVQTHDIQATSPARDNDWFVVETIARRSYEVRVFSGSTVFQPGGTSVNGTNLGRYNTAGTTLLTTGIGPDGPLNYSDDTGWVTVRWIGGTSNQTDKILVEGKSFGNPGANDTYEIEFLDTTYYIPRWNNSGTQTTVFLIQNTTPVAVTGSVYFYSAGGALLATQALNLAANGSQAISTAAIPALAGKAGVATIAHTGGYGALAAKSVALEPATGFSFDTPATPVPR